MKISVIDLVKKFCPTALVMMKNPSKVLLTLARIGPALQTAIRLDPKSIAGQANTQIASMGATAAKVQSSAAKAVASATQQAQTLIIKQARTILENYKKQLLAAATKQAAPVLLQIAKVKSQFNTVKKDICKVTSIASQLMAIQKSLKQANYKLALGGRIKLPTCETSTIKGKIKFVSELGKSVGEKVKRVQEIIKTVKAAQTKLEQIKKQAAALKSMSADIQALQKGLKDVGTAVSKVKFTLPPPKL